MLPSLHIAELEHPGSRSIKLIKDKLLSFNAATITDEDYIHHFKVNLFLRDEQHQLYGGLLGDISWKALQIHTFWVDPEFRGIGYGFQLLQKGIDLAKEQACRLILLETTSFHNKEFYDRFGFQEVGRIENFPPGHTYFYLKYELST
ncbi:MAG: GNAT family N-acetyltransferase [Bacteroidia bacterium]|nr:GNAT family N-acetyltransferase [Bacteroidia bacterium]